MLRGYKFGIDADAVSAKLGPNMPDKFAVAVRACCVAFALIWATAWAGEAPSPLLGVTRDQILARMGEPRSQITAGDRLIFFYARERIVFRGDVVIEVEPIAAEPVRRPPADTPSPATEPPPAATAPATTPGATTGQNPATPAPAANTAAVEPAQPEPKLEIKLVRPPGAKDSRPTPTAPPVAVVPPAPKSAPEPEKTPVVAPPAEKKRTTADMEAEAKAAREALEARKAAEKAAALEKEKQTKAQREARRRLDEAARTDADESSSSSTVWIVIGVVAVGLIGFVAWRFRQRQLELEATAVSAPRVPLAPSPVPASTGGASSPGGAPAGSAAAIASGFTAEYIAKLDGKRFEALVAAYYNKTGVIATRTNASPGSPVHLKISWKGEPKPFAYVQCIANASSQVDAKPLKDFVAALAADNLRRGYVVTPGKFTSAASDLAAQKQLTLMPGEVLLEKLNALPASARKEIVQEASLG